jgi:hypothetical protein
MKIIDSNLSLDASHQSTLRRVEQESLRVWRGGDEVTLELEGGAVGQLRQQASALLMHPPVSNIEADRPSTEVVVNQASETTEATLDKLRKLEVSLLKLLVERITGREIDVTTAEELSEVEAESEPVQSHDSTQTEPARAGWGMIYNHTESHYESEQTSFQAQGVVRTADGEEISIDIQLNMSRTFFSENSTTLRAGDALKDPLVVNFSGNAAELTRERYEFDIDADGTADQIHFLTSGSGFLALDRNGDGRINDGSELFGALSGNGFADLAELDDDGNGWIDEGDEVFERLRIWSRDDSGREQLVALGARGVGALYLGHITTPFEIKTSDNQLTGVVRQTGLYLQEEGGAGTLQQIDLVV